MKIIRDVKLFLYSLTLFIIGQVLALFSFYFGAVMAHIGALVFVIWAIKVLLGGKQKK